METVGNHSWIRPAFGVLIAIAIITAVASGLPSEFGALSLIPLIGLFWYMERLSRAEMGFVWGRARHYGLALLFPALVLSLVGLAAWIAGEVNLENTDWPATAFKLGVSISLTILLSIVTEEGFFRGWLWGSLKRAGQNKYWILVWTSLAFAAWHLPIPFLFPDFVLPLVQVPIYILNVAVAGVIMGLLRLVSGSVVVPSVSHGVWNGVAYLFFGTGTQIGVLGIQEASIYRPEVGILGLGLNIAFATGLWLWSRRADSRAAADQGLHLMPGSQSQEVV